MKSKHLYGFGSYRLDAVERVLLRDGQPITVPPKDLETLLVLVERAGHIVEKEELLEKVWPGVFVEEGNLARHIFNLRQVLGDTADGRKYIETIPRRGYRFVAAVREDAEPAAPHPSTPQASAQAQVTTRRRWLPWLVAAGLAFALVVALIGLNAGGFRERLLGSTRHVKIQSLAVLPLENLSKDPEQEYFADGMTDELITDLAKIRSVQVISRGSVMRYKGIKKPLTEIARELNVDAVVEGTVLRSGDRVRITAQLIHAQSDRHLWAESYERDLRDVLVLQSEVARTIAREIKIQVTPQEQQRLAAAPAVNPEAFELLLHAQYHHNEWTREGFAKAREYVEQAIAKDPNFALAHAWRGEIYFVLGWDGDLPIDEAFPTARAAALRALELDPSVAEAHFVLGYVRCTYDWNRIEAENDMRRAVETGPNSPWGHWAHAWHLMLFERYEDSIAEMRRARDLDPFNPLMSSGLTRILGFARRYDEAIEIGKTTIELYPRYPSTYAALAEAFEGSGKFDQAIAMYSKFRELTARGVLEPPRPGHVRDSKTYWSWMRAVLQKDSTKTSVPPLDLARVSAELGEKDHAFALLNEAVQKRAGELAFLRVSPSWDTLRDDARFQNLLRTVGLSGNLNDLNHR
ncbi:MAG TPA: winged helix-turn-helix domain-containing protein [Terriglobales bacterium]|nr:winged helix-turn-helix domain-containing protein [Terriglobales bacterium]